MRYLIISFVSLVCVGSADAGPTFGCNFLYLTGNYTAAHKQCRLDVDAGDSNAAAIISKMYLKGQGVKQNDALALDWQHVADRLESIARLTFAGTKTDADFKEICHMRANPTILENVTAACTKLAEKGDQEAQYQLAHFYDTGHYGLLRSEKDAVKWYRKAAENGHQRAQYIMADEHSDTFWEREKWYTAAAMQGDVEAQYKLAEMYRELSPEKAAIWYLKLAEMVPGDGIFWYFFGENKKYPVVNAQYRLGVLYQDGRGVLQNYSESEKWCRKSAEHGFPDAQFMLGRMYATGKGVPKDLVLAHAWLNKAASKGIVEAESYRDLLMLRMSSAEIKEAQETAQKLP